MWIECSRRQPAEGGVYRVVRRAMGNRPHYNDWCVWDPEIGKWRNRRGTVITTVEWWQDGAENPEGLERAAGP